DLTTRPNQDALGRILREVLTNYVRAERIMADFRPRVVLVEEANYSTNGPLVDVAVRRGVDVVQTVGTWRDDALISKRLTEATRRIEPKSVDLSTLQELEREPWTSERDAELDADFSN